MKDGKDLVYKLREIGEESGYTFSMIRTNTELHGLPQRRVWTFNFLAPAEIPKSATLGNSTIYKWSGKACRAHTFLKPFQTIYK